MEQAHALTRPLPLTGAGGLATLAIAWCLAPLSVGLQLVPNDGALFVIAFSAIVVLAAYAATRRVDDERARPGALLRLTPWAVMAVAAAGYWTSSATGSASAAVVGAVLATAVALVAAPPIYRAATPPR